MTTSDQATQTTIEYPVLRKKGFVSYSSKFLAASAIATLAAFSYHIIDSTIYGFKLNRHLSMFMLFSAALVVSSLTLAISYGVFKCYNKKGDSLKEAVKISNRKAVSISGKIFAAALAIGATSLACTLITSAINGQEISFLSLARETFGFSNNGAWVGGNSGLLLCFIASSFIVFAISSLIYLYSKDKNISQGNKYSDISQTINHANFSRISAFKPEHTTEIPHQDNDPSISPLLNEAAVAGSEKDKKKL